MLRATELGELYIQEYVLNLIKGLEEEFSKIDEADYMIMIETIHKVYQAMQTVYNKNSP